jgi:hypothetical protein
MPIVPHKGMVLEFGNMEDDDHMWQMKVHRVEYNVECGEFVVYCHDLHTDVEQGPGFTEFQYYHVWQQKEEDGTRLYVYFECHEALDCPECLAAEDHLSSFDHVFDLSSLTQQLEKTGWKVSCSVGRQDVSVVVDAAVKEGNLLDGVTEKQRVIAPGTWQWYETGKGWY